MEPIISVIVPVYNVEPYLEECVRSLQNQTLREIEIILVDDGSPDNCPQMCDRYAGEDGRIRAIHQENGGVSAARNAGLGIARGKYVAFVDPDDWVDPDYLSILLGHMAPGGMAVCDYVWEWDLAVKSAPITGLPRECETIVLSRVEAQSSVMRSNDRKNIRNGPWGKLYDRRLIEAYQMAFGEDLTCCEDELFVIQYLSHLTAKVVWIRADIYHYRYRPQSLGNQRIQRYEKFSPQIFSEIIALERELPYIEHTPEMLRCYKTRLLAAKKAPLAIMTINGWEKDPSYKLYLREIRSGLFAYLRCGGWPFSEKICTVLCAIHPRLYYLCRTAVFYILDRKPRLWLWLQRGR